MGVYIKGMRMPKECHECIWFDYEGIANTKPNYHYTDARCKLVEVLQRQQEKDERDGWIGKDISNLPGYGGYYSDKHCVEAGTIADNCPLVEVPEPHGRLIDEMK